AGDQPKRQARSQTPRDLLALRQRQPKLTTLPSTRPPPTPISDELAKRRVPSSQMPRDALDRHPSLAHIPNRLLVLLGEPNHHNSSGSTTSLPANEARVALIS